MSSASEQALYKAALARAEQAEAERDAARARLEREESLCKQLQANVEGWLAELAKANNCRARAVTYVKERRLDGVCNSTEFADAVLALLDAPPEPLPTFEDVRGTLKEKP